MILKKIKLWSVIKSTIWKMEDAGISLREKRDVFSIRIETLVKDAKEIFI